MNTQSSEGKNPHDHESIEKRDVRALTESMTVMPDLGRAEGANGLYVVVSHTGNQNLVDRRMGACECPDTQYRNPEGGCKHVRRVNYATGEIPIPAWVDVDAVDDCLGTAVEASPHVAATDGGVIEVDGDDSPNDEKDSDDGRPDECECINWDSSVGLPCWPCYRGGFRTVATNE